VKCLQLNAFPFEYTVHYFLRLSVLFVHVCWGNTSYWAELVNSPFHDPSGTFFLHKNHVCFPMGDQHWYPLIKMFQYECFEAQT